jgi:hypothetical protein
MTDADETEETKTLTVAEAFMRKIAGDPQFVKAQPSGKAMMIVGAQPVREKSASAPDHDAGDRPGGS